MIRNDLARRVAGLRASTLVPAATGGVGPRRVATRCATPCSQLASESFTQSDRAFLASTRKVAWKASSAACSSRSTPRQTRKTIDPCRSTRASKAARRRPRARRRTSPGAGHRSARRTCPGPTADESARAIQPLGPPCPIPSLRGLVRFPCNARKRGTPHGFSRGVPIGLGGPRANRAPSVSFGCHRIACWAGVLTAD